MPATSPEALARRKARAKERRKERHSERIHLIHRSVPGITYCYIQLPDSHIRTTKYLEYVDCPKCLENYKSE